MLEINTIIKDIISRPLVNLLMLECFFFGIISFFCGILGIIRKKDHSVFVLIFTILGFLVLLWVIGEIIFLH